ncbi:MAG TPA: LamG domain-containing protein [Kofleriaceae bacterium]
MSARVGPIVTLCACTFAPPPADIDGAMDVPRESIGEDPPSARFTENLVGFWTFDDTSPSTMAADTSGTATPVPMLVIDDADHGPPVFAGGRVTASARALLQSAKNNHLPPDCESAAAVTLEAWVSPLPANQGSLAEPVFITGLAKSVSDRDVVLLQANGQWLARVRTGAADGTPNLLSTTPTAATWTHLVVVADGTQRTFYVNNMPEATTAGGSLAGWDSTVAMHLFEEPQKTRHWLGSVALVALYNRALTAPQVEQNFLAGPDSP